jgi:hypothetical protein
VHDFFAALRIRTPSASGAAGGNRRFFHAQARLMGDRTDGALRAHFDERAAVLEYDQGLPQAEAEAKALAETYDAFAHRGGDLGVLGELVAARRRRDTPAFEPVLATLDFTMRLMWGVGHIATDGEAYRPAEAYESAEAAVIVPVFYDDVVDLVAESLVTRRMHTRLGVAELLGEVEVDRARETGEALLVFSDVMAWRRGDCRGAVPIDWRKLGRIIDGVRTLRCARRSARALHDVTRRCWPRPTIEVATIVERQRHAA